MKTRKKHDSEFKRNAVAMTYESGKTVGEVAAETRYYPTMLSKWRSDLSEHGNNAFPGHGRRRNDDRELHNLRKEIERLKQERDILKKAISFLATPQN